MSASSSPKHEEDIISKCFFTTYISFDRLKNDISVPSLIALKISSGSSLSFRSLLQQIKKDSNDQETQTTEISRGGGVRDLPRIQSFELSILNQTLFNYILRRLIFIQVVLRLIKVILCLCVHLSVRVGYVHRRRLLWGETASKQDR